MIKKRGNHKKREDYFTVKSIVWQHFILRQKKYNDIFDK